MSLPIFNSPFWSKPIMFMLVFAITIFIGANSLLPPVSKFEDASDNLITESLAHSITKPYPDIFMVRKDLRIDPDFKPYYSQFGLTYRLLLPLSKYMDHRHSAFVLSLVYGLLTAITLWLFSAYLYHSISVGTGVIFLFLCSFSPTLLMFSGSFYWQLPLLIAPFFIAYVFAPKRPWLALSLVGICLMTRFLGGYEYTSSLILSPLAAVLLRLSYREINIRSAFILCVALGIAGLVAFACALAVHLIALHAVVGTWEATIQSFLEVVLYRTNGDYFGRHITLKNDAVAFIASFFRNEIILICGLGFVTAAINRIYLKNLDAAFIERTLAFAFLAGLSWQILARGHMRDHAHINYIVDFIPFGLTVYIALSRSIGSLAKIKY